MTARGPRYEAQRRGELTYWTGKPCKNGHIDFRRTDNGNCCECDRNVQRPRSKARYDADPARAIATATAYRAANLETVQARLRQWRVNKLATDPQYYLQDRIRNRLGKILRGKSKTGPAVREIGLKTGLELVRHIESQFKRGMNWSNYGTVWELDHIIPLTAFDLTNSEQYLTACHYTNVRPLLRPDNIRKGGIRRPRY